jgi:hypothetical protein
MAGRTVQCDERAVCALPQSESYGFASARGHNNAHLAYPFYWTFQDRWLRFDHLGWVGEAELTQLSDLSMEDVIDAYGAPLTSFVADLPAQPLRNLDRPSKKSKIPRLLPGPQPVALRIPPRISTSALSATLVWKLAQIAHS